MKIYPMRTTDLEYIEAVRKSYKRRWLTFFIMFLLFLSILSVAIYFAFYFDRKSEELFELMTFAEKNLTEQQYYQSLIETAWLLGIRIGFAVAGGLYCGIFGVITAFSILNRRRDSLLLKYYDINELPNKVASGNPAS